jgi:hypothetical protein
VTPESTVRDALRRLGAAREECPHWDYETDGEHGECCAEVQKARRALRRAKAAREERAQ